MKDGSHVHSLIDQCKPLDINSRYAYLLLCSHFQNTCVVAEQDSEIVGFLSSYTAPEQSNVIFIWQVAVHRKCRGKGLASMMIRELLRRSACKDIDFIETTVSPSNEPSRKLFYSLAEKMGTRVQEKAWMTSDMFLPETHEDEVILRLGPIKGFKDSFADYRSNFAAVVKGK